MRVLYSNNSEQSSRVLLPISLMHEGILLDGMMHKGFIPRRDITLMHQTGTFRKTMTVVAGPTRHYFNVSGDQARELLDWYFNG